MEQWWEHWPPTNLAWVPQILASNPYVIEFVVGSLICSEWFFSGYSGFTLSSKTNISKFLFDQESRRRKLTKNHFVDVLPLNRWLFYLFIYLFEMVNIFSF